MTEPTPGHGPSKELVTGATGLVGMERLVYRIEAGVADRGIAPGGQRRGAGGGVSP